MLLPEPMSRCLNVVLSSVGSEWVIQLTCETNEITELTLAVCYGLREQIGLGTPRLRLSKSAGSVVTGVNAFVDCTSWAAEAQQDTKAHPINHRYGVNQSGNDSMKNAVQNNPITSVCLAAKNKGNTNNDFRKKLVSVLRYWLVEQRVAGHVTDPRRRCRRFIEGSPFFEWTKYSPENIMK